MKKCRIMMRERALRDLALRSECIRRNNPRAALSFLDAAYATARRLASAAGIGTRYNPEIPALADLRFFPITGFKNDLVFYRSTADTLEIVRVLHGARDIASILAQDFGVEQEDEGEVGDSG